jgi:hypothetical protein
MARKKTARHLHCTFQIVWMASRRRYEVHGDDGELHDFSPNQSVAIGIAQREATRECEGRKVTVCIEQKDGTFKTV